MQIVAVLVSVGCNYSALAETCYSDQGSRACGPAVGTVYVNCPDTYNFKITGQGSVDPYVYNGTTGDYQSLSKTIYCESPCQIIPCDGSPAQDGTFPSGSPMKGPNSSDKPCGDLASLHILRSIKGAVAMSLSHLNSHVLTALKSERG